MSKEPPRVQAEAAQARAADPDVSAFVAASAGSGKTKLLTDRLLRLMLSGADPLAIQCLTFTKAGAAEMALRLRDALADWVRADDATLDAALRALKVMPDDETRARARGLFARVLDLPGGMRIGTIHAFCQSVLRRFPLEAGISPHFRLVEERDVAEALEEAKDTTLGAARGRALEDAVAHLASQLDSERFGRSIAALNAARGRLGRFLALEPPARRAAIARVLDIQENDDAAIVLAACDWPQQTALADAARVVAERGSEGCRKRAGQILDWLALKEDRRARDWPDWMSYFLTKEGDPRGNTAFVNERLLRERPELLPPFLAEADRILAVEARRRDLRALELSDALASLGAPLLAGYAEAKARNDALDYDDLIARAEQLLHEPGAGWILYKLDGGLDHLLLDEVQDTAPAQWRIAGALTAEFFAGEGPSRAPRTVFAVGDRKQSIFRFQGADPSAFDDWRARLPQRVRAAGKVWRDEELNVSFRSTEPVLHLVDAVFADPVAARGVLAPDETLHHIADRAEDAGCVEVWPLLDADRKEAVEPWPVARENRSARDARQHLADHLADWIKARTSGTELLESQGRALQPGDVMVLVRSRRNGFAERLTRALKARGVKVGGLDRMVLTEQQAVRDLVTLGEALLLPDDDLSFAAFLVSPLGGVSHASLEDLALSRAGSLRQELQRRAGERADWRAAEDFFAALLARVDFCAPFQLYSEALGALGGRARLLARLGAEAEEPIGEFLNASLSYARLHPPSLQGFLHWLCRSGAEIKREQEEAGDAVRIMTVHGAKGLQAPLVILPDTTALPPDEAGLLSARLEEMEIPILAPNRDARGAAVAALQNARRAAEMEEYNRLLYVALTRAADRLLVCGWKGRHEVPEQSWYNRIRAGIERLSPTRVTFDAWPGEVLRLETPQRRAPRKAPAEPQAAPPPPPAWLGQAPDWHASPPPAEPSLPEPLAPSRPEGVELGSVPPAASPLGERVPAGRRFQRGQWVHALLQHLPGLPATRRRAAAVSWLRRPGIGLAPAAAAELADEVMAILEHPELADLFGPHGQAEVPLTGVVAERVVGGLVDRLAVLPERVILADYKTNRDPPRTAEATPVMYLRQMAAYRALLAAIFPDRPIRCVLVWTRASLPVMLPDALLDAHAPGLPLAAAAGTPA